MLQGRRHRSTSWQPVRRRRSDGNLRASLLAACLLLLLLLSSSPKSSIALALASFVPASSCGRRVATSREGSTVRWPVQRSPCPHGRFDRRALRPLHLTRQEELEGKDAPIEADEVDEAILEEEESDGQALTRTVNQRLLDELKEAAEKEASGSSALSSSKRKSKSGTSNPLLGLGSRKTDEERQASIDEARNLNGINPVVAIAGSLFALGVAAALWSVTNAVAESFATHPVESDLYVVQRAAAVFRNVVMGLFALASGFFGVTGVGIMLLGVRVAIGVAKGELDPTPLPPVVKPGAGGDSGVDGADRAQVLSNAWDLMTGGGGGGRAGRRRKNDGSNSKK